MFPINKAYDLARSQELLSLIIHIEEKYEHLQCWIYTLCKHIYPGPTDIGLIF
jgi:hypothetical protein